LHIYAGASVYQASGEAQRRIGAVLARAAALESDGVRCHGAVSRDRLVAALQSARTMLYRGDPGETFCLALAEAQAMGVPAVVQPIGSVVERVIDGATGHVAADDAGFAAAAIALLRDDDLWRRFHVEALARQRGFSWDQIATKFEALI
jgi:glycosyltransferase involved in cell wall biosynthesis